MDLIQVNKRVLLSVQHDNYSGYDPFDFLNSHIFNKTGLNKNTYMRLAWLQLGKRLGINIRPFVGVPKNKNPKGIGLFILGLIEDFKRTNNQYYLHEAIALADWLLTQKSDQNVWQYPCWGYHFDWQARAFYVPKGKPNIITTCYVARALYSLGALINHEEYIEQALNSARFIQQHLLTKADGKQFYAYIPGEIAFIHNASLWGAAWVAYAGAELGDNELRDAALKVAEQSVKQQRDDGAWVYGDRHHHQFIDGFHTGYNLEALDILTKALNLTDFNQAIDKGMHYYRNTFFLEDGTAKYYHNNIYPLDMHSFAQGVLTLLKVGGTNTDVTLAKKVMQRAVKTMYLPKKGQFIYQKSRWFINKINYIRWTQAWAYYGMAFYNHYVTEKKAQ